MSYSAGNKCRNKRMLIDLKGVHKSRNTAVIAHNVKNELKALRTVS